MGLFSFFSKNKQDRAAEDSGRFYSKDDDAALGERARSKRASHAGAGAGATPGRRSAADPMLPQKKRARRRLVGAIALALAAAVGLPMLLDSEPKPLAGDIAIQIPSKDKAAPLPVPGEPADAAAVAAPAAAASAAAPAPKAVAAEQSIAKGEEIVTEPPKAAAPATQLAAAKPEAPKAKPEPKLDAAKPEHKEPKAEHKDAQEKHKAELRLAEKERAEKLEKERADRERAERAEKERLAKAKAAEKEKEKDKPVKPVHDDSRALAILEGKPAGKAEKADKAEEGASQKFVVQVAAMSSQEKAAELQAKLSAAGISSWTQKSGELIKVKIGPLKKDEAEKVRAKLNRIGQSGFMTPA